MREEFQFKHSEMFRKGYLEGKYDAYIALINHLTELTSDLSDELRATLNEMKGKEE